jgi:hypothetical protein
VSLGAFLMTDISEDPTIDEVRQGNKSSTIENHVKIFSIYSLRQNSFRREMALEIQPERMNVGEGL